MPAASGSFFSIERVVTLVSPIFVAAAGWATSAVAKYGIHLDKTGVTAALVTGATAGLGAVVTWLHGRIKHTNLQAQLAHDAALASPVLRQVDPGLAAQVEQIFSDAVKKVANDILPTDAQEIAAPPPAPPADTPPAPAPVVQAPGA